MTSIFKTSLNMIRCYHSGKPKFWQENAVRYGLIDYYPRHPDHQDPPVDPSKILMVQRVKQNKGMWHKHRKLLENLGLKPKGMAPAFVKNTPEMCKLLWKLKYFVKITPVLLPKNMPSVDDLSGAYIHENGTFHHIPKIDVNRYQATENFTSNPSKYDKETISEQLRLRWVKGI